MTVPFSAMVSCIALLNPQAPMCMDVNHKLFLCVRDRCATIQQLSVEWKRHPRKQTQYLRELYGQ